VSLHVFVYGTLRRGFPNHGILEDKIVRWAGVGATVQSFPLIVPHDRFCTNPGCRFVHRMGVLCDRPGEGVPVEGDLFEVEDSALAAMDRLENYDPGAPEASTYLRRTIEVRDPEGRTQEAECYFLADTAAFRALLDSGQAEMVPAYEIGMARGELKACCRTKPGHQGTHDVIEMPEPPSR